MTTHLPSNETGTIYVEPENRFVVSLIVGYSSIDDVFDAKTAAAAALALTTDGGKDGTLWHVYDRVTGRMVTMEQGEFENVEIH